MPAPKHPDQYWNDVVLLLDCDGADTSTDFKDKSISDHAVTANNNAQVDTAQSKFGGASLLLDGTDDHLSIPHSTDLEFGSSDFTVECWIRFNAFDGSGFNTLLTKETTGTDESWRLDYKNSTNDLRFIAWVSGSATVHSGSFTASTGTWYHFAATYDGSDVRIFVDGALLSTTAFSSTIDSFTSSLYIGQRRALGPDRYVNGWIDDIRITKGVARYTSAFTAPTKAHPSGAVTGLSNTYGIQTQKIITSPYSFLIQNYVRSMWDIIEPVPQFIKSLYGINVQNKIASPVGIHVKNTVLSPWQNLIEAVAKIKSQYGLQVKTLVASPWEFQVGKFIKNTWNTTLTKTVKSDWRIKGLIQNSIKSQYRLLVSAFTSVNNSYTVRDYDTATKKIRSPWFGQEDVDSLEPDIQVTLKKVLTGELIELNTASLQLDEDSWAWRFDADISGASGWQSIRPEPGFVEVEFTVGADVFNLLIEGSERVRPEIDTIYKVNGRSKTALLSSKHAAPITKVWTSTTAKTIAQELCNAVGITLDWVSVDWPISRYEAERKYPIDIIIELSSAVGSIIQSQPNATLIIQPRHIYAPSKYADQTPDFTLSDVDEIFTISDRWEERPGFDSVEVGNESVGSEINGNEINVSFETEDQSDSVLIKVFITPFQPLTLEHSALGNMDLQYQGIVTESRNEIAVITEGRGRIGAPFYGLILNSWKYVNLGTPEINERGDISTPTEGQSLLDITYLTKYHAYRATATVPLVQIFVDDIE